MIANPIVAHPPKARLTVRVGVTGHRPNRLLDSDEGLLCARIQAVLQKVATVTNQVLAEADDAYTPEPPALRVISALAEGADRLVAEEALALNYELHCPLPFARDEYARDFATEPARTAYTALLDRAKAVLELVNDRATPEAENEAYEAVGRLMLRQSDVLIVIWNGAAPAGQGGTGQMVREALSQHIPCVWIHPDAPHLLCTLEETDITDAGAVADAARSRLAAEDGLAPLTQRLRDVLLPPPSPPSGEHPSGWAAALIRWIFPAHIAPRRDYFAETQPQSALFGIWFTLFRNLLIGQWRIPPLRYPEILQTTLEEWRNARNAAPDLPVAVDQQVEEQFCRHYAWADKLANYYADLYRSFFVLNYLFSAGAVALALLSFALSGLAQSTADVHHAAFDYFVAIEMVLILTIIAAVVFGKRCRWHERWIEYRLLAEQFRQMRFLALLGHNPPGFRLPAHHAYDDPSNTWVQWHSRAVIRAAGLVNARIDAAYLEAYRRRLTGDDRDAHYSPGEIQHQIDYHHHNAERLHKVAHRLHRLGLNLFVVTLVVCADHLFLHWLPPSIGMVLAGAAPAFGAALAGILIQGEFELNAPRQWIAPCLTFARRCGKRNLRPPSDISAVSLITQRAPS